MLLIHPLQIVKISSLFAFFVLGHAIPDDTVNDSTLETEPPGRSPANIASPSLEIIMPENPTRIKGDGTIQLTCKVGPEIQGQEVWWTKDERNLTDALNTVNIRIENKKDLGSYTCMARTTKGNLIKKSIDITSVLEPGRATGKKETRVNLKVSTILSCWLEGYLLSNFTWEKIGETNNNGEDIKSLTQFPRIDTTHVTLILYFTNVTREQNGTYKCSANDHNNTFSNQFDLIVTEEPEVEIEFIEAVGTDRVYLNWTINDHNEAVQKYFIEQMKEGTTKKWEFYSEEIGGGNSSYVLKGLTKGAAYRFRISAKNSVGKSRASIPSRWITTWEEDLEFIPKVSVLEKTSHSITLVRTHPPKNVQGYVHYYKILASNGNETGTYRCPAEPYNIYKILNLEHEVINYQFNVVACNNYTKQCGRPYHKELIMLNSAPSDRAFWSNSLEVVRFKFVILSILVFLLSLKV